MTTVTPDIENLFRAVDAVIALHDKTEPEGIDPHGLYPVTCFECGAIKPCPTLRLLSFFRGFTFSGGSVDEPVCTCGPWQIGQPEGHLAGCPRARLLSGGSVDEEDPRA